MNSVKLIPNVEPATIGLASEILIKMSLFRMFGIFGISNKDRRFNNRSVLSLMRDDIAGRKT